MGADAGPALLAAAPAVHAIPPVVGFLIVASLSAALAFASVRIRHHLRNDHGDQRARRASAKVDGRVLWSNIKYVAEGPVAEFIMIFSTIAFVAMLFWMLLTSRG
jgi:hypothetical protein